MTRTAGDDAGTTFTLRRVQALLGLSRSVIDGLIAAGFIAPTRGPRNVWRFTFQDLMLLRTALGLQAAKIPPRRIVRALARLKASLPAELPLSGLRITAIGADVAVRDRSGQWQADSGQLLIDFDVLAPIAGTLAFLDRPLAAPAAPAAHDAADAADASAWFQRGVALEAADPPAAEAAYRQALALDAGFEAAYLNLGALLSEARRFIELALLSDQAVAHCVGSALVHFNRGVAFDHLERLAEAADSYERSLALDPALADAHYNLARVREQLGDARGALRHFSAYKRLQR